MCGETRPICRIPCYVYREGRDFRLPPIIDAMPRDRLEAPEYLVLVSGGSGARQERIANPAFFLETSPDEAEVFLFPYDIGPLINWLRPAPCADFLESLPYLRGRESRHVFSDDGDVAAPLPLPVWLFKHSLLTSPAQADPVLPYIFREPGGRAAGCIVMPYSVPAHVLADAPSFDWESLRYACSFVGGFTHAYRNVACVSLKREMGSRFYDGGFEKIDILGSVFVHKEMSPQELAERQERFRRVTRASLTVLCPPGVGPQSIRLYETLYYGRIPVLFTRKVRYPLEHLIDYERFCFFIDEDEIMETGPVLSRLLAEHSTEELRERCVLACKIWNRYFRRDLFSRRVISMLGECLDRAPSRVGDAR